MPLIPPHSLLQFLPAVQSWSIAVGFGLLTTVLPTGGAIAQSRIPAQADEFVGQAQAQQMILVNPATGNDAAATGTQSAPFRTITRALQVAQPNTTLLLAPGTYSAESGEVFPLRLKAGVTIQGDPTTAGRGFLIRGGGDFISPTSTRQNIAVLGADQAMLIGVTVTNSNPRGYGVWIESSSPTILSNTLTGNGHDGISTVGDSAPLIQGNIFNHNGANGITIFGASHPEVRQNVFEQTGFGVNIADTATPLILDNRISQNRVAIVIQERSRPVIRGNLIEGSQEDGVATLAQALPDLGTAAEPGNNVFLNNRRYDINATTAKQVIPAAGNQLTPDRTAGNLDLAAISAPDGVIVASTANQLPIAAAAPILINQLPPTASPAPEGASQVVSNLVRSSTQSLMRPDTSSISASSAPAIAIPVPPAARPNTLSRTSQPISSAIAAPSRSSTAVRVLTPNTPTPSLPTPSTPTSPRTAAINIPVPPPDSRSLPALSANATLPKPPNATEPTLQANTLQADLLPVPDGNAPVGNIGDLPTVAVPGVSGSTAFRGVPAVPLQFRVLVEATSDRAQSLVKSLVPNAFLVQAHGRSLMQAGAFSSRENAEEIMQTLNRNGLRATIERIDE
ncbi:DUF1565 domain-containing protein [Phormidium tenue FACHB-886]|nr:DUF1565 domain-containing protein [Phormidium tenue FACHB-886]